MAITETVKEFDERVIAIDRVARVVKGGRRFRFRATVVVGDGKGRVGVGVGKGGEVMTAVAKSIAKAKKNMITIPLKGTTIAHEVEVRFSGARVFLKPASEGTGVIAGGAVRNVVEVVGIHDLLSKSLGSSNKVNNAYATVLALTQLRETGSSKPQMEATKQKAEKPAAKAKLADASEESPKPKATKAPKKEAKK
jgi:small subunit ribosomal protein S5